MAENKLLILLASLMALALQMPSVVEAKNLHFEQQRPRRQAATSQGNQDDRTECGNPELKGIYFLHLIWNSVVQPVSFQTYPIYIGPAAA
jgi:hypothetical protein